MPFNNAEASLLTVSARGMLFPNLYFMFPFLSVYAGVVYMSYIIPKPVGLLCSCCAVFGPLL